MMQHFLSVTFLQTGYIPNEKIRKNPFEDQISASKEACDKEKYEHDVSNVETTGLRFRGKKETASSVSGMVRKEVPAI